MKKQFKTKMTSKYALMNTESGRSMVEMLGVLAIIGVITVGGLAGYNYGMNRYRTNEILDGGTKRAYTVSTQITTDIPVNLSEFVDYNETAGGTFDSNVELWGNEFGIKVSGVKKEVCENLIRMIGDNTPIRAAVNADSADGYEEDMTVDDCADGNNNNLLLVYNYEMLSNNAVASGGRDSDSGSSGNCWTTHSCTEADPSAPAEAVCSDGKVHHSVYCNNPTDSMNQAIDNAYQACRAQGYSGQCCDCSVSAGNGNYVNGLEICEPYGICD